MNPYTLLAVGVLWMGSLAVTAVHFDRAARDSMLAASYQEGVKSIRKFNEYRAEDLEAVRLAGERQARAALKARQIQYEFEMEALHGTLLTYKNPPVPGQPPQDVGPVVVSPTGMRLLNAAIAEYNASAVPATSGPDPVPPNAPADKPGGAASTASLAALHLRLSGYLRQDAR